MSRPAPGFTADGVDLIGYHDVDGKPVFKLAMQVVPSETGERWYLYATHFWEPRLSIFDVTDPANPVLAGAIEGPDHAATWQVQVADRLLVQGMEHRPPAWGGDPATYADEGVRLFDVTDAVDPKLVGQWRTGDHGVHRNHYTGGRYLHVTAGRRGFEGNIYVILDIADPSRPEEVAIWFLPEQYVAAGNRPSRRISLHGPPYVLGDRAYLSYGAAGVVILDISDIERPQLVSRLDIGAAFSSMIAMHTVIPVPARNLLLVNTEAIAEGQQEPYNFAGIVDVSDEHNPRLVSLLPIPVPAPGAPYRNFSTRGGRFGPHNQHHPQGPELFADDNLMFMTWFNAGLRVYDISDEYLPREISWYLPDDPTERRGLLPKTLVTQSEDVLVDARGNIFFSDKNHGLHVVRLAD
ncbi:hypothetical protein CQY20_17230 [Mycolicibacterium agri]|uniref:Uncharacterized protein n=1 Tax=Mycolicibacterium agri TaxID=36811 RepID=A0A2A7MZK9_MYCAG|nr:hypothetical protein [Mycolicibacterium agri]PEG37094.1 hypothetical protein CQY20_17230 [Mycolicibacterium agri]GFG52064.1 hypothetical protein MAGR_35050 [Mycolicibacterium agri]